MTSPVTPRIRVTAQVCLTGTPKRVVVRPAKAAFLSRTTSRVAALATPETLGYFTVTESERSGWTGGLLVLNSGGRPLEFQCTLPVRPSRAHEILYGPTLREHVIGEVIGPALLKKCRTPLSVLCCDQPEAFGVRACVDVPVVLAAEAAEVQEGPIGADAITGSETLAFAGGHVLVESTRRSAIAGLAGRFADFPDLAEPFERIREAIREAQTQLARAA